MYKHLTKEQRYAIDVLLKKNVPVKAIAATINVHYSTVYRELQRNRGEDLYHYGVAQEKSDARKLGMRKHHKFSIAMRKEVLNLLINEQWSPEQIHGWMKRNGKECVCVETIYRYIRLDRSRGGDIYKHCRQRLKHSVKNNPSNTPPIKNRTMIDARDPEANGERFGDWEMDTIVGKNGKGAIVTLVERSKDYLIMRKLKKGKNAESLAKTVVAMMTPFIGTIKSITTDNGSEFAAHQYIARKLKTKIYFTHPYASWEKGNIENTNGLIREYIPKKTDFQTYTDENIKQIQTKINARPRKKLQFALPKCVFYQSVS